MAHSEQAEMDTDLAKMRDELTQRIQSSRVEIIARFNIAPPRVWLARL